MSSLLQETYNPKTSTIINTKGFNVNELFEHYIYLANDCIVLIFNGINLKIRKDISAEDIKSDIYTELLESCYKYYSSKNRCIAINRHMKIYAERYIKRFNNKVEYLEKRDGDTYYYIDDKSIFEYVEGTTMERITTVLSTLTQREQRVLYYRFFESMTCEEIAKILNLSNRERARQIEARALRKLRHPFRSKQLKDYFEFYK